MRYINPNFYEQPRLLRKGQKVEDFDKNLFVVIENKEFGTYIVLQRVYNEHLKETIRKLKVKIGESEGYIEELEDRLKKYSSIATEEQLNNILAENESLKERNERLAKKNERLGIINQNLLNGVRKTEEIAKLEEKLRKSEEHNRHLKKAVSDLIYENNKRSWEESK